MLRRRPSFSCTADTLVEGIPVANSADAMMPGGMTIQLVDGVPVAMPASQIAVGIVEGMPVDADTIREEEEAVPPQ